MVEVGGASRAVKTLRSRTLEQGGNARHHQQCGDVVAALGQTGVRRVEATYDFASHTHGSIGPSCAVAAIESGKLISWSASQATHNLRKRGAVRVQWMRADEHGWDGYPTITTEGCEEKASTTALLRTLSELLVMLDALFWLALTLRSRARPLRNGVVPSKQRIVFGIRRKAHGFS